MRSSEDPDSLHQPAAQGLQLLGDPVSGQHGPVTRGSIQALDPQLRRPRAVPVAEELPAQQVAGAGNDFQPVAIALGRPEQDLELAGRVRPQVRGEQRARLRLTVEELQAHERRVAQRSAYPVRHVIPQRRRAVHRVRIAGSVVEQVHWPGPRQHRVGGVRRPDRALHAEIQQLQQAAVRAGPVHGRGKRVAVADELARLRQPLEETIPRTARQQAIIGRVGRKQVARHAEERPVNHLLCRHLSPSLGIRPGLPPGPH